jgi:head-tail adaptor
MKLKTLSAGDYRHVGQFYNNAADTRSNSNQVIENKIPIGTPKHFAIETLVGFETFLPSQVVGQCTHLIRLRWYSADITSKSWLEWGSKRFEVKYVLDLDGMKREMVLGVVEQDA